MPSSLRLGFAGTPEFAVAALDALAASRHGLAAVFTKPDRPAGRGQTVQQSPVGRRAAALGLHVHQPESFKTPQAETLLRSLELDALIVVAYGLILPAGALAAPRLGCFNIHASLLPRWRGAAPIHRAVLSGDAITGITIMRMETGLDTGPMLAVRSLQIEADETTGHLHDRLARLGGELIVETLDSLAVGSAHETPQPAVGITYADKISKAEAMIDWTADAAQIVRRVRAFNPWPIAESRLEGVQLRIWEAQVAPTGAGTSIATGATGATGPMGATGAMAATIAAGAGVAADMTRAPGTVIAAGPEGIDVVCGNGVVRILRLQLAGRKPMVARDFINAQPVAGARLAAS